MAGLPWIELDVDLPRNRKSVRLRLRLGEDLAWAYMAQLWCWCAGNLPEGTLSGPDAPAVLEAASGWKGEPGKLFDAAVYAGFLDADGDTVVVHGWAERAWAHIAKRKRDAARQKAKRKGVAKRFSGKKTKAPEPSTDVTLDVARTSDGRHAEIHCNSNSNSNNNSNNNQKLKAASTPAPPDGGSPLEAFREKLSARLAYTGEFRVAAADASDPGKVLRLKSDLEKQIARVGLDRAVEICAAKALEFKSEHRRHQRSLSYFIGPLRDVPDPYRPETDSLRLEMEAHDRQMREWEAANAGH